MADPDDDVTKNLVENGFGGRIPEPYLAVSKAPVKKEFSGIIHSKLHKRWIMSLPVSLEGSGTQAQPPINVTFVVDTACPCVTLTPKVTRRLGINDTSNRFDLIINGITVNSSRRTRNVLTQNAEDREMNFLGCDFWLQIPGSLHYTTTHFYHIPAAEFSLVLTSKSVEVISAEHRVVAEMDFSPIRANRLSLNQNLYSREMEVVPEEMKQIADEFASPVVEPNPAKQPAKKAVRKTIAGGMRSQFVEYATHARDAVSTWLSRVKANLTPKKPSSTSHQSSQASGPSEQKRPKMDEGESVGSGLFGNIPTPPHYNFCFDEIRAEDVESGWGGKIEQDLAESKVPFQKYISGILTKSGRPVVSIPCNNGVGGNSISVNFVVDENARFCYLSRRAISAFWGRRYDFGPLYINEIFMSGWAEPSKGPGDEYISILGSNFLRDADLSILTDWANGRTELVPTRQPIPPRLLPEDIIERVEGDCDFNFVEITEEQVARGWDKITHNLTPAITEAFVSRGALSAPTFYRPIISLPCHAAGQEKGFYVVFVVDRHQSSTLLSQTVIEALLGEEAASHHSPGGPLDIVINGTQLACCMPPQNRPGSHISFLGRDYLKECNLSLVMDWENDVFEMKSVTLRSSPFTHLSDQVPSRAHTPGEQVETPMEKVVLDREKVVIIDHQKMAAISQVEAPMEKVCPMLLRPSTARSESSDQARIPEKQVAAPMEKVLIDREKVCPMLLRIFLSKGRHNKTNDYNRGNVPECCEVQIYTWMDCTLKELMELVKDVNKESTEHQNGIEFRFAIIFPEERYDRYDMREIGSTIDGQVGPDDGKTLAQCNFEVGDYIDVAIIQPGSLHHHASNNRENGRVCGRNGTFAAGKNSHGGFSGAGNGGQAHHLSRSYGEGFINSGKGQHRN